MNEFPKNPHVNPWLTGGLKAQKQRKGTPIDDLFDDTSLSVGLCYREVFRSTGFSFWNRVNKGIFHCCVISHGGRQLWRPPALVCVWLLFPNWHSILWTEFPPVPLIYPYHNRRGLLSSLFLWRRVANTEKKIPHLHPNRKEGQINYVSQRKKQTDWWTPTGLPGEKSSPNLENSLPGCKSSQSVAVE